MSNWHALLSGRSLLSTSPTTHLLGARGQLHAGDPGVGVVRDDDGVVARRAGNGAAVAGLLRSWEPGERGGQSDVRPGGGTRGGCGVPRADIFPSFFLPRYDG